MLLARLILAAAEVYAAVGVIFAMVFVTRGVGRVDAGAVGAGVWFRVVIRPGVAALWPVMLRRWWRARR